MMKMLRLFGLLTICVMVLAGCGGDEKKQVTTRIPSEKIRVVNVLEQKFYDDAHIAGSVSVPLAELKKQAQSWDKEVPVVAYCSNYRCSASIGAARILKDLGFKNVAAYEGGMAEWYQLSKNDPSYKVEGPAREEYLSIVLSAPTSHEESGVTVLTAQELKRQLVEAGV